MLKCPHSVIKERQEGTGLLSLLPVVHQQSKISYWEQLPPPLLLHLHFSVFHPAKETFFLSSSYIQKAAHIYTCENISSAVHTSKAQNNKTKSQQNKITAKSWLQQSLSQAVSTVKLFMKWHEERCWWYFCQTINPFQPSLKTGKATSKSLTPDFHQQAHTCSGKIFITAEVGQGIGKSAVTFWCGVTFKIHFNMFKIVPLTLFS